MKFVDFITVYFGERKFYRLSNENEKKLKMVCDEGLCDTQTGLEIILVVLGKRKASMVPEKFEELYKDLKLYTVRVNDYIYFITKTKRLIPKIKKIKSLKNRHAKTGKILEYPPCCIRAFTSKKSLVFNQNRGFEVFLLHGKCKKNCKSSKKIMMKYARTVKKICPKMYLKMLGFWFCLRKLNRI